MVVQRILHWTYKTPGFLVEIKLLDGSQDTHVILAPDCIQKACIYAERQQTVDKLYKQRVNVTSYTIHIHENVIAKFSHFTLK